MRSRRPSGGASRYGSSVERLFLVRHAEVLGTREGQFVGWSDPPLTARGRRQAERLAREMARLAVTRILSSPQQRALATARPIAQVHRVPVTVRPELAELDFGEWEGRSWRSLAPRQRRLHRAWLSDPWHVTPPGGESLRSLWRRVGRVWRDLQASLDGGATVVVAHGGSLRVLLCRALRLPPRALGRFWLRPGAVSCLAWDAGCAWIEALNHDPSGL